MSYIVAYSCFTAAGMGVKPFMNALHGGKHLSNAVATDVWPAKPQRSLRACLLKTPSYPDQKTKLIQSLIHCWNDLQTQLNPDQRAALTTTRVGFLLASTKGAIEDQVWNDRPTSAEESDLISPILDGFIAATALHPTKALAVSSACSSSHAASYIAHHWLHQGLCDYVVLAACDAIGPFIANGFNALKALASDHAKPFSAARDGLMLGEAAACVVLSAAPTTMNSVMISAVETISEGFAATRADEQGTGLQQCINALSAKRKPDLIIAHGTGTQTNDVIEDRAYAALYGKSVPITGTKWCIGHTMGVSGALDMIAACEVLKTQKAFSICNDSQIDATLSANYLYHSASHCREPIDHILVSSVGFGGIQAALMVSRPHPPNEEASPSIIGASDHSSRRTNQKRTDISVNDANHLPPVFIGIVSHWNQLDEAARCLVILAAKTSSQKPDLIILASPEGSFKTDQAFAKQGAISPSKFIHTLPNVRGSSLLQALGWSGPVLCIQRCASTVSAAIDLADSYARAYGWVCHVYSYTSSSFTSENPSVSLIEVSA